MTLISNNQAITPWPKGMSVTTTAQTQLGKAYDIIDVRDISHKGLFAVVRLQRMSGDGVLTLSLKTAAALTGETEALTAPLVDLISVDITAADYDADGYAVVGLSLPQEVPKYQRYIGLYTDQVTTAEVKYIAYYDTTVPRMGTVKAYNPFSPSDPGA